MKIWSNNIKDNWLDQEFGANSTNKANFELDVNTKSFHLAWDDLPENTKSLVVIFDDYDAIEVCGFTWIHWTVANIDPNLKQLQENASNELADKLVQGKNSWSSGLITKDTENKVYQKFGGCAPPNADHEYSIKVYALDKMLEINNGFMLNELIRKMKGHILDAKEINFWYKKIK